MTFCCQNWFNRPSTSFPFYRTFVLSFKPNTEMLLQIDTHCISKQKLDRIGHKRFVAHHANHGLNEPPCSHTIYHINHHTVQSTVPFPSFSIAWFCCCCYVWYQWHLTPHLYHQKWNFSTQTFLVFNIYNDILLRLKSHTHRTSFTRTV